MGNTMLFSMLFKVLDAATGPIKGIAAALQEPASAAAAVGESGEKASTRLRQGFARASTSAEHLSQALRKPIAHLAEFGRAAGEASEKFAHSFGGMGALVAEGFSIKDVAGDDEFWRRQQINFDMTGESVERLKEETNQAAVQFGVSQENLTSFYRAFRETGGTAEVAGANIKTAAAAMQLLGLNAEDTGSLFGALQTKMHLEKPEQFLSSVALIRQRLIDTPGGAEAFAQVFDRISDSMEQLGMRGPAAADALSAVFAVAAKGSGGNARRAASATEQWLDNLTHWDYVTQLSQGLGEAAYDRNGHVKSPVWLMQKMLSKYAEAYRLPANQQQMEINRLDGLFGDAAAHMFKAVSGEVKATGHSETLDKVLGAKGDGAELLKKAGEASETLSGSLTRLRASMAQAAEAVFTGPVQWFAAALSACGGVVGKVVVALGALAAVGHAIAWVGGAIKGFGLLGETLGFLRLGSVAMGLVRIAGSMVPVIAASWAWTTAMLANPATWSRLGSVAMGLVRIAGSMVPVIAASWAWTTAMLANPVTWVVLGIVAAVAACSIAVYALATHWKQIWSALGGPVATLTESIKRGFGGAWDWVRGQAAALVSWLASKFSWLTDTLHLVGRAIGLVTAPARQMVTHVVTTEIDTFKKTAAGHLAAQAAGAVGQGVRGAMAWFQGRGWSHDQAAGLVAGFDRESGLNPQAVGDGGRAYGIGQWHPDRQAEFAAVFGHDIRHSTLAEQMQFAQWELTAGPERKAGRALAATTSAGGAGAVASMDYERPADRAGEAGRRAAAAESIAAATPDAPSLAAQTTSAARADSAATTPAVILVRFEGLPQGAKAQVTSQTPGLVLKIDRGMAMVAG